MDEAEFLNQLKREFVEKSTVELDLWEESLLAYEESDGRDSLSDVNELMRLIHSMKGSSQAVGLGELATVLHRFEKLLIQSSRSSGSREFVSRSLSVVDFLREYFEGLKTCGDASSAIEKMKAILPV